MNRAYFVVLALNQTDPVDHTTARRVSTDTHGNAACEILAHSREDDPARVAFREGREVFAWVWDEKSPKHPNGAPFCVHGLTLRRGEPSKIGGGK